MKKKALVASLVVAVLGFIVGAAAAWIWYSDNRRPNFSRKTELFVYPGMSVEEVLSHIPDSVVLRKGSLERVCSKMEEGSIRPGHYVIDSRKPSAYVPRMLKAGWQTPVKVVLSGTMRLKDQLSHKIASQLMVDSAAVHNALEDDDLLELYGFTPEDVFSLILPDTYEFYWTASMREFFERMKKEYDAFWTEDRLRKATLQGLSQKEVSIMASIVSGETNYAPEYPAIAGVYLNRYHSGMRLQADPTVAFCYDYSINRILKKHTEYDSPYNTYMYDGLPPGPICVPPKACIDAVLNPDTHPYFYFCASAAMDGTHKFAATLREHSRNAEEFHRALDARKAKKLQ